jgi:hypothetical protein
MPRKTAITPEKLFHFAKTHAEQARAAGESTLYPTFRATAKRFRCTHQDIEDAIYDYQGTGYMDAVVGYRTGGGGTTAISVKGDQLVEAYD